MKDINIEGRIDSRIQELLIDKKVYQAKSEISDGRLRMILWIGGVAVALLGVILPLYLVGQSRSRLDDALFDANNRIDKALQSANRQMNRMEDKVNELVNTQLKNPEMAIFFDGQKLNHEYVNVSCRKIDIDKTEILVLEDIYFKLENIGKDTASDIRLMLYIEKEAHFRSSVDWYNYKRNETYETDEPAYSTLYKYEFATSSFIYEKLDPHEPPVIIKLSELAFTQKINKTKALFKIYYGQKEPTVVPFSIIIHNYE